MKVGPIGTARLLCMFLYGSEKRSTNSTGRPTLVLGTKMAKRKRVCSRLVDDNTGASLHPISIAGANVNCPNFTQ